MENNFVKKTAEDLRAAQQLAEIVGKTVDAKLAALDSLDIDHYSFARHLSFYAVDPNFERLDLIKVVGDLFFAIGYQYGLKKGKEEMDGVG